MEKIKRQDRISKWVSPVRDYRQTRRNFAVSNGVKLIIAFIFKEEKDLNKAKLILKRHFGTIDFESDTLNFFHTDYYTREFGSELKRGFISFKRLLPLQDLYKIKIITNRVEQKLLKGDKRRVNIDPGYLDLSKLILFTTKDYSHRIYINLSIYAEVTLFFKGQSFRPWPWTYPDYKSQEYIAIFNQIRKLYVEQLKNS